MYIILDHSKDIWIVSDARRKTDIAWFKSNYDNLKLIRITADECTRKERGYNFIQGTYTKLVSSLSSFQMIINNFNDMLV